jgi:16S rRNA (cytidine1402-2'-O)-methyltransferase
MLYVVPVPIGNLEDITLRALRILQTAEVVICEDGRETSKLLNLLNIEHKPRYVNIVRGHELNRREILEVLQSLERNEILESGIYHKQEGGEAEPSKFGQKEKIVALVSDAGTPGMSDPGFEVIQMAQELKVCYTVLPGPTAMIPAAVSSCLVSNDFLFLGFLPIKKGRQTEWQNIIRSQYPIILYESSHRIQKFIQEARQNLHPERKIAICRELSKKFEEIWVGQIKDVPNLQLIEKGEFVVIINQSEK